MINFRTVSGKVFLSSPTQRKVEEGFVLPSKGLKWNRCERVTSCEGDAADVLI